MPSSCKKAWNVWHQLPITTILSIHPTPAPFISPRPRLHPIAESSIPGTQEYCSKSVTPTSLRTSSSIRNSPVLARLSLVNTTYAASAMIWSLRLEAIASFPPSISIAAVAIAIESNNHCHLISGKGSYSQKGNQGAKKTDFWACSLGKILLWCTGPKVILTSPPKLFFRHTQLQSTVLL